MDTNCRGRGNREFCCTDSHNEEWKALQQRVEESAIRVGTLEKASKTFLRWKPRRCFLFPDAFYYMKASTGATPDNCSSTNPGHASENEAESSGKVDIKQPKYGEFRRTWVCISLRDCLHLVALPHDIRVFLLQTKTRSYYWRASSQRECETWLSSIATQCVSLRDIDLFKDADERLTEAEYNRASNTLAYFGKLRHLEGALAHSDIRELFEGIAVDYFRTNEALRPETNPNDLEATFKSSSDTAVEREHSLLGQDSCKTSTNPGITLQEVLAYIHSFDSTFQHVDVASSHEKTASKCRAVRDWLERVLFLNFMESPIIQRRVAQLAASRSVVSWGCDPLRSPLLCSEEHTGKNVTLYSKRWKPL